VKNCYRPPLPQSRRAVERVLHSASVPRIFTIGHSTHAIDHFMRLLKQHEIELLADIRRFPSSARHPQFNREALEQSLRDNGIAYEHYPALGGRRKPVEGSRNNAWRHNAFRGYADYMETGDFAAAVNDLAAKAMAKTTAYMCSEGLWWQCHRSLVSDHFKAAGWTVYHIFPNGTVKEHPYSPAARIVNGRLDYSAPGLFDDGAPA
jgi:uncharacterized protein (DUF488 family)